MSIPIGTITAWSTNTAPKGWLICNGGVISRTTYINLFNVIGTTFGIGDGNSTFNLPYCVIPTSKWTEVVGDTENAMAYNTGFGERLGAALWSDNNGWYATAYGNVLAGLRKNPDSNHYKWTGNGTPINLWYNRESNVGINAETLTYKEFCIIKY